MISIDSRSHAQQSAYNFTVFAEDLEGKLFEERFYGFFQDLTTFGRPFESFNLFSYFESVKAGESEKPWLGR